MHAVRRSRISITLMVGVAAFGCQTENPVGSMETPSFSAMAGQPTPSADHIVSFGGSGPGDLADRVAALGGTVKRTHSAIGLAVVTGLSDAAAAELRGTPGVTDVVRDLLVQLTPTLEGEAWSAAQAVPTGPAPFSNPVATEQNHDPSQAFFFPNQWDMRIIHADAAWAAGFRGDPNVRVAILDSGLDPDHQDLLGLIDEASSAAFVPSLSGPPAWADDRFHGTHVGGTVASNGLGTAGVAPHVTLVAVKVLNVNGQGTFGNIIGGIFHAVDVDVDIINMSLGGTFPKSTPGIGLLNAFVNRAVNYANRAGVLTVSSAGNAATDLDHNGNVLVSPCESGAGMCISATGPTDQLASYSNFGTSSVNVGAPGGDFVVTGVAATSTVMAPCSSRTVIPALFVCTTDVNWYLFLQGTSMAAPHVAGAAALLDSQEGGAMNAGQLKTSLQQTADDLGKRGVDPAFGNGRINVCRLLGCS